MKPSEYSRLKTFGKCIVITFVISFAAIFFGVIMGWFDEPLNGWIETSARRNMNWLDRIMLDATGPQNPMSRARRENMDMVKELGIALGFTGATAVTSVVALTDVLFGFTKRNHHQ